ncbi:hypothetical protein SEA_MARIETTA_86 [Gordonia phage Marietta]|uniref:Uncharacterized protein n=1 Tax=Gordonia phage Marietta TaxID=2301558 RepID=A0A385DSC1_9CAUD|nr:hypothetical protein KNU07_gp86 [Gordonia phage Marietta]AXQ61405.1 hypothetical protein SEA_MARIETTA_86 [Gordonia phage Marietta]QAU06411.1 hypothetical protein SEA_WHOSEMANZ_86 [Gordonia phage WhoseManz]
MSNVTPIAAVATLRVVDVETGGYRSRFSFASLSAALMTLREQYGPGEADVLDNVTGEVYDVVSDDDVDALDWTPPAAPVAL